jgi:hypothetical protein
VQGFVEEGVLGPVVERVAGVQVVEVRGGEGEHRVDEVSVLLRLWGSISDFVFGASKKYYLLHVPRFYGRVDGK